MSLVDNGKLPHPLFLLQELGSLLAFLPMNHLGWWNIEDRNVIVAVVTSIPERLIKSDSGD
jgi:hypothetical protein